jgi:diguanylate cyclase (GGDEF)-like protein
MLKNSASKLWTELYPYRLLDPVDRFTFRKWILIENIRRLKSIAVFGVLINLIIMGTVLAKSGLSCLLQPDMIIRGLWILLAIVYLVSVGNPREIEDIDRKHYPIFVGAAALSLLFSSLLSTYISMVHGYSLVHVINLMLIGCFIFLSVAEFIVILAPSCLYLGYFMATAPSMLLMEDVTLINITATTLFALLIVKMTLQSKLSNLKYEQELQKQNAINQQLANLDGLTNLYNRRFLEEELKRLDTERNLPLTVVMGDVNGLKLTNDAFGHRAGDSILRKTAKILKTWCRASDIVVRMGGDEFAIILPNTTYDQATAIVQRIREAIASEKVDWLIFSVSFGWATKQEPGEDLQAVMRKAEEDMYQQKLEDSIGVKNRTRDAILRALDEKNERERQHANRVSQLCALTGMALGLNNKDIEELRTLGLLHDIGKIALDNEILDKPGRLNDAERREVRRHVETGYRIMSSLNEFAPLANNILTHHERWDGQGYPQGLKGESIPLAARILTVAEAYDVLTTDKPYRQALGKEAALEEIRKNAGTQFDPDIARIFIDKVMLEKDPLQSVC